MKIELKIINPEESEFPTVEWVIHILDWDLIKFTKQIGTEIETFETESEIRQQIPLFYRHPNYWPIVFDCVIRDYEDLYEQIGNKIFKKIWDFINYDDLYMSLKIVFLTWWDSINVWKVFWEEYKTRHFTMFYNNHKTLWKIREVRYPYNDHIFNWCKF